MAENVFILGAGASVNTGAPVMKNFLDKAEDLLAKGKFGDQKEKIQEVFNALYRLRSVAARANIEVNDNFEDFFGIIDMAKITGRFAEYDDDAIDDLRTSLINMVVMTLEKSIEYSTDNKNRITASNDTYSRFVDFLETFDDKAIITLIPSVVE